METSIKHLHIIKITGFILMKKGRQPDEYIFWIDDPFFQEQRWEQPVCFL